MLKQFKIDKSGLVYKGPVKVLIIERQAIETKRQVTQIDLIDGYSKNGKIVARFDFNNEQDVLNRLENVFNKGVYVHCHRNIKKTPLKITLLTWDK